MSDAFQPTPSSPQPRPQGRKRPKQKRFSRMILGYLALAGLAIPGLQRFYMQQYGFGVGYLLVGFFPFVLGGWSWLVWIPRVLSLLEAAWILTMANTDFDSRFNREMSGLEWTSLSGEASVDIERKLKEMKRAGLITEEEYRERLKTYLDSLKIR